MAKLKARKRIAAAKKAAPKKIVFGEGFKKIAALKIAQPIIVKPTHRMFHNKYKSLLDIPGVTHINGKPKEEFTPNKKSNGKKSKKRSK